MFWKEMDKQTDTTDRFTLSANAVGKNRCGSASVRGEARSPYITVALCPFMHLSAGERCTLRISVSTSLTDCVRRVSDGESR